MSERSLEEEIKIKAEQAKKLARYMSSTQDLVENQIVKAQQRGDFDNLEGAGKPLNLEENPFEPLDLRMTYKILKDNDFAPYWIELGKEIDAEMNKIDKEVNSFKRYTEIFFSEKHGSLARRRYEKRKALSLFEIRLIWEKVHKKIIDYNLHCPTFRLGRANIDVDDEMYKVISNLEKMIEQLQKQKN
ncbi:MAG: DUF1992 domain-containing protein [Syntrophomonadaceae bacterium]|nr:DUF1992 domain-containing protein [Syntrophomonadaceae bacterium]